VGVKLLGEYLRMAGYVHFEIDKWFSFALIAAIFVLSYLYARRKGPAEDDADEVAAELFKDE
jgi:hypothetical protein